MQRLGHIYACGAELRVERTLGGGIPETYALELVLWRYDRCCWHKSALAGPQEFVLVVAMYDQEIFSRGLTIATQKSQCRTTAQRVW